MKTSSLLALATAVLTSTALLQAAHNPPSADIANTQLKANLYLPSTKHGFYRGTRFDWSGVINSLQFAGHDYYGPWFTKTDPTIHDFIYDNADITAGPCSAITGPVDEFKPLGWDDAKPGATFIKIGIGALRKPTSAASTAATTYDNYHLYDLANPGKWQIKKHHDAVDFTQTLNDPSSGYAYVYRKSIQLTPDHPELLLRHSLKNTGKRAIKTTVYNHNFLVLDHQPPGPGVAITLPFQIQTPRPPNAALAEIIGNQIEYTATLQDRDTVAFPLQGFTTNVQDNEIRIENRALHAGMTIKTDRPLISEYLWSIRSVLAVEPYISISIEPGQEFTWTTTYNFYTLPTPN